MRNARWLIVLLALVAAPACRPDSSDMVRVAGTVQHLDLEGGFWAVRGDDGKTYDPFDGLPAEFQKSGLRVFLEARLRRDAVSVHMAGPIVDIIAIRRL